MSSIWSLPFQFNNFKLANGHWNNNWSFQPVLPVGLTKDWNLVTRPVMPFYNVVPHETASGQFERTAGLGDMILAGDALARALGQLDPRRGADLHLPDGDVEFTGQGKWQAGPVLWLVASRRTSSSACSPSSGSPSGRPRRPATSQLNLQPIASVFFGDGWNVGYSGIILANWKAPSGDIWTVPLAWASARS